MTGAERHALHLAFSTAQLERLQREEAQKYCTRCDLPVDSLDLSPGRRWCRNCENDRRRRCYRAARAQVAA